VAKAAIRREIEGRAAAPNVLRAIEIGSPVAWPLTTVQLQVGEISGSGAISGFAAGPEIDTFGVFCWLHGAGLINRLEAEIDELDDDAAALTDAQRAAAERKIAADALEVERRIEALIEMSEQQGMPIARNSDADARAVLSLSGDLLAPARP
jgi:hypothetical protein